jgi:hypothetical protein
MYDGRMTDAPELTRMTLNLNPRAAAALATIAAIEQVNRTVAVNRALQLYVRLVQHVEEGGVVLLRDTGGGVAKITWV